MLVRSVTRGWPGIGAAFASSTTSCSVENASSGSASDHSSNCAFIGYAHKVFPIRRKERKNTLDYSKFNSKLGKITTQDALFYSTPRRTVCPC